MIHQRSVIYTNCVSSLIKVLHFHLSFFMCNHPSLSFYPQSIGFSDVLKSASHVDETMLHSLQERLGETSSQSVVVAVDRYVLCSLIVVFFQDGVIFIFRNWVLQNIFTV